MLLKRSNYVVYVDLKHLIINTHCKIEKPCLSLLKIAKAMLTLHMRPRVKAPGSHLPSQLSWPIYVHSFIPCLVSLFKQHNLGPIPLSNRLLLRGSDWVQSLTRIFRSTGTAGARKELCISKGKEEFKVKAQLFNLQPSAAWSDGNFGGGSTLLIVLSIPITSWQQVEILFHCVLNTVYCFGLPV